MPRVISVDPVNPDATAIGEAAAVLAGGGLVAFPTETVYGLGARGLRGRDVARIFAAKRRPPTHPLILHVDGTAMARSLVTSWPEAAERLAAAFWPGPLTLVLPRAPIVPAEIAAGLATVALRAPSHPVAVALVRAVGEPLAAPSANAHMHVSPTSAQHVIRSLGDAVDLVLDAGPCEHGIESTVVTLAEDPPRVLRPGALALAELRAIVPSLLHDALVVTEDAVARASPGLAAKHYAPRAKLVIEEAGAGAVLAAASRARSGERVGALVWSADAREAARRGPAVVRFVIMPDTPDAYGQRLYASLYDLDESHVDAIVVERPPTTEGWWAVTDRLSRAHTP